MSEHPDARRRMVAGAADMIRRRGLAATSVRDLAKHTGAPLGSTYHPSSVSRTLWASAANLVRRLTGTSTPSWRDLAWT